LLAALRHQLGAELGRDFRLLGRGQWLGRRDLDGMGEQTIALLFSERGRHNRRLLCAASVSLRIDRP
jgi:hypothetical protein